MQLPPYVLAGLLALGLAAPAMAEALEMPVHDLGRGGFVRDWTVVGGFPNAQIEGVAEDAVSRDGYERDFLEPVGGESAGTLQPDRNVPFTDRYGNERTASPRLVQALPFGLVDLNQAFAGADFQVAYAACRVRAAEECTVNALFGSDDSARVWVNGGLVHSVWTPGRGAQRWEDRFPVHLRAGDNDLLVKVEEAVGGWGFCLELYHDEDMDAAGVGRLQEVSFDPSPVIVPEGASALQGVVQVAPADEPVETPVVVTLYTLDNELISRHEVVTSQDVALPLPEGCAGYVELRMTVEREGADPVEGESRAWVGDYGAQKTRTLAAAQRVLAGLRAQAGSQDTAAARAARRQIPIARFAEAWLAWEHDTSDVDLETFAHVRRAVQAMARGRDFQLEHPGSLPVLLDLPEGTDPPAVQFWVSLPRDYASRDDWPVIIHLHGGGGREPWVPDNAHPHEGALWNYKRGVPMPYVSITTRRVGMGSWDPDVLNRVLDHVLEVYDTDPERVSLTGFSFGGFGTYAWALRSPERFAALAVLAGSTGTADLWKIRHIPIWIIHGERDQAVPVYSGRTAAAALSDLGADVRLTILPEYDHGIQQPFQRGTEFWAWLASHERRDVLPQPPDAFPEAGLSEPALEDLPAAAYLYVPLTGSYEDMGYRDRRSLAARLYTAAYAAGAEVLGPILLRATAGTAAGPDGPLVWSAAGLLVDRPVTPNPDLLNADLPAALAYVARYRGPADELPAARAEMRRHLLEAGAALSGEVGEMVMDEGRGGEARRVIRFLLAPQGE
jgi:predicted esterase